MNHIGTAVALLWSEVGSCVEHVHPRIPHPLHEQRLVQIKPTKQQVADSAILWQHQVAYRVHVLWDQTR